MKQILFSILLSLISSLTFGQYDWGITFDNSNYLDHLSPDTTSNPDCSWQIGHPDKTVFTSAYSEPNAIMTDTIDPVSPNDTSTFYLMHLRDSLQPYHIFSLIFWYQLDGDTTDAGIVEISPDNGLNWINMLTEDTTYQLYWMSAKPSLTGSTAGWQQFSVDMTAWASDWSSFPIAMTADTIRFRFTYITDSLPANHDGWIIDNIAIEDIWEGIEEVRNDNLFYIYPNPVKDKLFIKINRETETSFLQILNNQGQVFLDNKNFTTNYIDVSHFKKGIYFLKYSNNTQYAVKKFVIE